MFYIHVLCLHGPRSKLRVQSLKILFRSMLGRLYLYRVLRVQFTFTSSYSSSSSSSKSVAQLSTSYRCMANTTQHGESFNRKPRGRCDTKIIGCAATIALNQLSTTDRPTYLPLDSIQSSFMQHHLTVGHCSGCIRVLSPFPRTRSVFCFSLSPPSLVAQL